MPALLVVALIVVPLVEIYVLVQVGRVIGALPTIGLLLAMSLLGGYLLRREGARTWSAFRAAVQAGRVPAAEVADGALVLLGGALLLTPGFATDVFGLLCILPPSRAGLRRLLTGVVLRRLGVAGMVGAVAADRVGRRRGAGRPPPGGVVEGEVVDGPRADDGRDRDDRRGPDDGWDTGGRRPPA